MTDCLEKMRKGLPPDQRAGLFGETYSLDEANIVILPIPWDATSSYGTGSAKTPTSIIAPSHQLDLEDRFFGSVYEHKIHMLPFDKSIKTLNSTTKRKIKKIREDEADENMDELLFDVNLASEKLNIAVYESSYSLLQQNKKVGILGGDHASPFGFIKALSEIYEDFGVLHIDAHFDLRQAYEGFRYSHASIFYNVLDQIPEVSQVTHVGIRDYSAAELEFSEKSISSTVFFAEDLFRQKAHGIPFANLAKQIISTLPKKVYISFDIDGLEPQFCPNTGTPVPGGLDYLEAVYLLEEIINQEKEVIGFDLCEVSPGKQNDWDMNVGARILYKLCGCLQSKKID